MESAESLGPAYLGPTSFRHFTAFRTWLFNSKPLVLLLLLLPRLGLQLRFRLCLRLQLRRQGESRESFKGCMFLFVKTGLRNCLIPAVGIA